MKVAIEEAHAALWDSATCKVKRTAGQIGYAEAAVERMVAAWPELGGKLVPKDIGNIKASWFKDGCPHEVISLAARAQQQEREAAADMEVATVLARIPSLDATWEGLHAFMTEMELDIQNGSLDKWKASNNRPVNSMFLRCARWSQRTDLNQEQRKIIGRFDTACRRAFF